MRRCQDCDVALTSYNAYFPKWQKRCEECIKVRQNKIKFSSLNKGRSSEKSKKPLDKTGTGVV